MNIFILEDEWAQSNRIQKFVHQICRKQTITDYKIQADSNPDRLMDTIAFPSFDNLYLLDIHIKNDQRKGLEFAQQIRAIDKLGVIVFVTTHAEFAPETYRYKVSALDFINKEMDDSHFIEALTNCIDYVNKNTLNEKNVDLFYLHTQKANFKVPFAEILYFTTYKMEHHRVALFAKNLRKTFYSSLTEVQKIDSRLIRCHASFLVNPFAITGTSTNEREIILSDGTKLPTSRKAFKEINKEWEKN